MLTYFGVCDSDGDTIGNTSDNNSGDIIFWNDGNSLVFTCPGTGNQVVKEISAHILASDVGSLVRCAIYSADGNTKICEGSAGASIGLTGAWCGHLTQADITPNPTTLVGGTTYRITFAQQGNGNGVYTETAVSGGGLYKWVDYVTGGWPSALPAQDGTGYMWPVRCGVESAIIEGSTCWGHVTGVLEDNIRTFTGNWTGTGSIESSGDLERLALSSGQYMESEVVETSQGEVELLQNEYSEGDSVILKYRQGTSEENCLAASWNTYSVPFSSLGYVQIRVEVN